MEGISACALEVDHPCSISACSEVCRSPDVGLLFGESAKLISFFLV
jgi:hypothetical protein